MSMILIKHIHHTDGIEILLESLDTFLEACHPEDFLLSIEIR